MDDPKLPEGYSQEDFNLLTEEERQGLLEQAKDEEADKALGATGDGDDDTDTGGTDEEKAAAAAAAAADDGTVETGAADTEAAKVAAAAAAAPADDTPAPRASALPRWTAPADIDEQISGVKTERRELLKKFDDGELTGAELAEQQEKLDDKLDGLKETKLKASMSIQSRQSTWKQQDVPAFMKDHAEYKPGSIRYNALDQRLRELQADVILKDGDDLDPALLIEAHRLVEEELGPAPGAKPAPKKDARTARPAPPPSLGGLPAADAEDATEGGEFAHLDRLQGQEYEDALARLSPSQQEAYLAQ